ncbi:GTP pyrophosphokinase [Clostridium beijerinckii]|uniref:GTP pyrophosphokinase n=1 Tax=Clostridium beijerinckii TaxID=1520 RepID=UPI00098C1C82|nr:hypothetical protein [Clostridium beijerinckii]NRT76277.1 ppGpp synthetase/RelA/SpoT-type nucleotidyltransferase [Clostridium beijerinckii]OOM38501.1 GTP pyrophosphokinase YjbM [Clostridium beijerinckii]
MINKEENFLEEYEKIKPMINEWGNYVNNYIVKKINEKGFDVELFLKIKPQVRLKGNASILEKAFYRGKNYSNPLHDITDKVGIRFVVLLLEDINIIKDIVEKSDEWISSKDRDFEKEREEKPTFFDYQSVHYVVTNNKIRTVNNITIEKDVTCEIQIRTLLQHAYSELTHDTVYKPKQQVEANVQRLVARSMAMIETTDGIFKEVSDAMINLNNLKSNNLLPIIKQKYLEIKNPEDNSRIQDLIINSYHTLIQEIEHDEFKKFVDEYFQFMKEQINAKYTNKLLFRQSIVILLYYLVKKYPVQVQMDWPLTDDLLRPIYTDLGIRFET